MTTHDTQIIIDAEVPLVQIIREFDASARKVFDAHTDPDLLAQWVGPNETTTRIDTFDCRTGGAYRYASLFEGEEYRFYGSFHEVDPDRCRIVQTFCYEGMPDGVALETLTITDIDGGRCRLETTSLVGSFEDRDAFVASGMETGVREGYEKLDAVIAS